MLRQTLIILIITLATSCENETLPSIQWGPNPKQDCGNWLTFDFDNAIYFHDTTGTLYKNISDADIVNSYALTHKGKNLSRDNIDNLNAILSCKMYCGSPSDSVFYSLINPEHLVTFTKGKKVVGYISADFYSGTINSLPTTKSTEYCALKVFFESLNRQ